MNRPVYMNQFIWLPKKCASNPYISSVILVASLFLLQSITSNSPACKLPQALKVDYLDYRNWFSVLKRPIQAILPLQHSIKQWYCSTQGPTWSEKEDQERDYFRCAKAETASSAAAATAFDLGVKKKSLDQIIHYSNQLNNGWGAGCSKKIRVGQGSNLWCSVACTIIKWIALCYELLYFIICRNREMVSIVPRLKSSDFYAEDRLEAKQTQTQGVSSGSRSVRASCHVSTWMHAFFTPPHS